jgi:uncharacterized protein (DUF433 family)
MRKGHKVAAASKKPPGCRTSPYQVREYGRYIVAHQGICHGQPTFKGTRLLVHVVLESLARPGRTVEQVAEDYRLPVDAVVQALQWAAAVVQNRLRVPDPRPDDALTAVETAPLPLMMTEIHEAANLR